MISIQKDQVPEYLRSSPLFENAFQEAEDDSPVADLTIEVPANCFKPTPVIHNERDLHFLLRTVRFWLIPEYIEDNREFLLFVLSNRSSTALIRAVAEFGADFPFLAQLSAALEPSIESTLMCQAAQYGLLGLVKYLREDGHDWDEGANRSFTAIAAAHGQAKCLRFALENGCKLQGRECNLAAAGGHVECLQCAHEHGGTITIEDCKIAVEFGRVACVKYIMEATTLDLRSTSLCCDHAAKYGQLQVLKHLLSIRCPTVANTVNIAALHEHMDCMRFLLDQGCPGDVNAYTSAVLRDNLDCIQCLHEHNVEWSQEVPRLAISLNKAGILMYLLDNGCPCDIAEMRAMAVKYSRVPCIRCIDECIDSRRLSEVIVHMVEESAT